MSSNNENHYFSKKPQAPLKIFSISESLRGHLYIFKTTPGVFSSRKIDLGTKTLIKYMEIPREKSNLLDMGCGYGPIGLVLAKENPNSTIFMVDINRRAIWCARENTKINQISNAKTIAGSYFEPINSQGIKFDGIYTNPPLKKGKKEFLRFCESIPNHLKSDGMFQFVIRRTMGAKNIFLLLQKMLPNMEVEVRFKRSGFWVFYLKKKT